MIVAATAFIVGLQRTDGRACAVRVRCPWCARIHIHRWPTHGAVTPPCGTHSDYRIKFHIPKGQPPQDRRA